VWLKQGCIWLRGAAPTLAALQGVRRHLQGIRRSPEFSSALPDIDVPQAYLLQEEEEERSDRWKSFLARQPESSGQDVDQNAGGGSSETLNENATPGPRKIEIWTPIRLSLSNIKQMMSLRVEKKQQAADEQHTKDGTQSVKVEQGKLSEDSDDEFYDVDKVDPAQEVHSGDAVNTDVGSRSQEEDYISKEELECLVHGGLPMALRGEVRPV
jgi:hypothetical protein